MKSQSPYIRKYIKDITTLGYIVSDNGGQLSKVIGMYEILITDLTVRGQLFDTKTVLIWFKNIENRIIVRERIFKYELLPLPFRKIDSYIKHSIEELNSQNHYQYEKMIPKATITIGDLILKDE